MPEGEYPQHPASAFWSLITDDWLLWSDDMPNSAYEVIVEKAPREWAGGNSAFTAGATRTTYSGLADLRPILPDFTDGELVGGLFYYNYPGGSGLTSGAVFGRHAGWSAAQYARARTP
jgi:hypothetical protein